MKYMKGIEILLNALLIAINSPATTNAKRRHLTEMNFPSSGQSTQTSWQLFLFFNPALSHTSMNFWTLVHTFLFIVLHREQAIPEKTKEIQRKLELG